MDKQTMEYLSEKVREYSKLEDTKIFLIDMKKKLINGYVRLESTGGRYILGIKNGGFHKEYDAQTQADLVKDFENAMVKIIDANTENLDKRMEEI